jgi:hypothetical protein
MRLASIILGLLGGLVGVLSAIRAFLLVGNDPLYHSQLWADGAALVFAVVAGCIALIPTISSRWAGGIMLAAGVLGFITINLYYINTFYIAALLLWIIGGSLLIGTSWQNQAG